MSVSKWVLPISQVQSGLTATVLSVILVTALIFNPLLMGFIIRDKKLSQPSYIFLFCLLVIDFLEALLSIPFYIATHILHGWKFGETDMERQAVCNMVGFFFNVFLSVSICILGIVSFDRFFYIVFALKYRRYMKPWVAWVMVIALCLIPVIVSAFPLFGFSYFEFNQSFGACLPRWRGQTPYVIVYVLVALVPYVLVFVFTTITCCYLRRYVSGSLHSRTFSLRQNSQVEERGRQSLLTRLFALLLVTQIVCFMPGFLTAFIGARFSYYIIPQEVFLVDFILVLANAAINPIIQSLVWKKLRNKLCWCCQCRCARCEGEDSSKPMSPYHHPIQAVLSLGDVGGKEKGSTSTEESVETVLNSTDRMLDIVTCDVKGELD